MENAETSMEMQRSVHQEEAGQKRQTELSLEEAFDRLDGMLAQLEDRDLPLEESFRLYQQGMEILKLCNEKIDTVEKKILIMNGDGELDEF